MVRARSFSGLNWVRGEIEEVIRHARDALEEYVEGGGEPSVLGPCIAQLSQARGVLEMLQIHGAARLADEMRMSAQAVADQQVGNTREAAEALMLSLIQLPDYLEKLEQGDEDIPLLLLPSINDLRASRGAPPISESSLVLSGMAQAAGKSLADRAARKRLRVAAHRARPKLHRGLINWFRDVDAQAGLGSLRDIFSELERLSECEPILRGVFRTAHAVIEGLLDGSVQTDTRVKGLVGRVDRVAKELEKHGVRKAVANLPQDVVKDLLVQVARSGSDHPVIRAVKQDYQLDSVLPDEDTLARARARLFAPNANALAGMRAAAVKELVPIKDTLDLYMRGGRDKEQLTDLEGPMRRLASTLGMTGMDDLAERLMGRADDIQAIGSGASEANDTLLMRIAGDLLFVESSLDNVLGGAEEEAPPQDSVGDVPLGEMRSLVKRTLEEASVDMAKAKESIVAYLENPTDPSPLKATPSGLHGVAGALRVISHNESADLLDRVGGFIESNLLVRLQEPSSEALEALAEAISGIEYYMEAVSEGRQDTAGLLEIPETALNSLEAMAGEAGEATEPQPVPLQEQEPVVTPEIEPTVHAAPPQDEIDPEILEIFLEEAHEELELIRREYGRWRDDPETQDALGAIRRSYHTLKGSGRLAGARTIGDYAWSVENLLNRVIDQTLEPDRRLIAHLDEAVDALPELIAAQEQGRPPELDVAGIIERGEALADNRLPDTGEPGPVAEGEAETGLDQDTEDLSVSESMDTLELTVEDSELLDIFQTEGHEHLDYLADYLEACAGPDAVCPMDSEMVRALHTLAGSARMASVDPLADIAKALELKANALQEAGRDGDATFAALLTDGTQRMRGMLDALVKGVSAVANPRELLDRIAAYDPLAGYPGGELPGTPEIVGTEQAGQPPPGDAEVIELELDDLEMQETPEAEIAALDAADDTLDLTPDEGLEPISQVEPGALGPDQEFELEDAEQAAVPEEARVAGLSLEDVEQAVDSEEAETTEPSLGEELTLEDVGQAVESEEAQAAELGLGEELSLEDVGPAAESEDLQSAGLSLGEELTLEGVDFASEPGAEEPTLDITVEEVAAEQALSREPESETDAGAQPPPSATEPADQRGEAVPPDLMEAPAPETVAGGSGSDEDYPGAIPKPESEGGAAPAEPQDTVALEIDPELREIFLEESLEILDRLDAGLREWHAEPGNHEHANQLQRALHTLKGSARLSGIAPIGDLSHALETLVQGMRDTQEPASSAQLSLAQRTVDHLSDQVEAVRQGAAVPLAETLVIDLRDALEVAPEETEAVVGEAMLEADAEADEDEGEAITCEPELIEIFLEEARDLMDRVDSGLSDWQAKPADQELPIQLKRTLHTLKGSARLAGIKSTGNLAHALESLLEGVTPEMARAHASLFPLAQRAADRLSEQIEEVGRGGPVQPAGELVAELEYVHAELTGEALEPTEEQEPAQPPLEGEQEPSEPAAAESGKAPAAAQAGKQAAQQPQEQVRVRASLLNRLVNNAGEISIYRARLEQQNLALGFNLSELEQTVTRLHDQLRQMDIETEAQILYRYEQEREEGGDPEDEFDPLELDRFSTIQQLSRSLMETVNDLSSIQNLLGEQQKEAETLLLQQSRISNDLQDGLLRTRMLPFSHMVPRLHRLVRQTANTLNKRAVLEVFGAEGEMDRGILDRMLAPMEHILRNAVSHGIEAPGVRRDIGKDETGKVSIYITRDGNDVVITVSDDGAGLNLATIRKKAVERGLLEADAELDDDDIMQLVLEPGFSTVKEVTQISGRGVGTDVVVSEVKQLGGTLDIDSQPGRGTSFSIRLPFTLAISEALLVGLGDDVYAIPHVSIEGVVRIGFDELNECYAGRQAGFRYAGHDYQVRYLGDLLGTHDHTLQESQKWLPLLLVRSGEHRIAIQIDQVMGNRQIVVKSVGQQLSTVRWISGGTILADGRVALILDVSALVRMDVMHGAQIAAKQKKEEEVRRVLVMVVDDSITVRKVTARLLKRHNMDVISAKDGVDAVAMLQDQHPDVMLLDIEMPRMDGYELARHMRSSSELNDIPIIMITSRSGQKHRDMAMSLGVKRYLGKPYQESDLLENIYGVLAEAEAEA